MPNLESLARQVKPPDSAAVRSKLTEYLARTGLSHSDFAARIGYSQQAVSLFLYQQYARVASTDLYLRAAVWDYIERHPVQMRARVQGKLFETENYRRIRRYFLAAIDQGEICLLYGPPGTQKSFVLEYLLAQHHAEKKNGAVLVYASDRMRPLALLKRVGRAAGAWIAGTSVERLLTNLLDHFAARAGGPPAVLVDEAQHLDVHCLELLRELHDRSGCGMVLAGSHNLFENFLRGRQHLEQWLSRIDHKDPLPGLSEEEVGKIAAHELSNGRPVKLSEGQVRRIVAHCRVDDIFARGADGRPAPVKYLSVRRLVKFISQLKRQKESA